ncbi:MAG: HAD-IIIA family hydrolase [Patescibacteria group bacterium]
MDKKRAVFIDRDGVVVNPIFRKEFKLPSAPFFFAELSFFAGIKEALDLFKEMGFLRILVTNQPDVGYGHISEEEWSRIQRKVEEFYFDDVFICRHTRDIDCVCKKPKPGMLFEAAKKWDIDFCKSYMVGDTDKDMNAGRVAGCKTILIKAYYNVEVKGNFTTSSLLDAARLIERIEKGGKK